MRLANLLFPLVILGVQTIQADEFCEPIPLEHEVIKERSRMMQFSDGKTVTVIGHHHGDREATKRFSNWVLSPQDELSTDDWQSHVAEFIKSNERVTKHTKENLAFLRASVWMTKEPIFVAMETRNSQLTGSVQNAMSVRADLFQEFNKREIDNPKLMRDAELIVMGAPLYSYLYDEEWRDSFKLLGMEGPVDGNKLQMTGKKTMQVAENRLNQLKKMDGFDEKAVQQAMQSVIKMLNKAYDDVANILVFDHTVIRNRLMDRAPHMDTKIRGTVLSYLFGYLDYLGGMKKRDVAFSRKLANQKNTGIFFVGEEHLVSLTNLLQVQCKSLRAGIPVPEHEPPEQVIEEM